MQSHALKLIISFYIFFWSIFSLSILLPFGPEKGGGGVLFLLNMVFCTLVSIPILFFSFMANQKECIERLRSDLIYKNLKWCSILSIMGFVFILYDRVFIRGIDYTVGLRAARYQWLESMGGSFFSILGNLLVPLAYVGVFLLFLHGRNIRWLKRNLLFFMCFSSIIGHAALNGGRSNLIILILVILFAFCFKKESFFTGFSKKIRMSLILAVPVVYYVFGIVESSALMGGVSVNELLYLAVISLYGTVPSGIDLYNMSELEALAGYSITYLVHGQWTAQIILDTAESERVGSYLLYPISFILARLGILERPFDPGMFSDTGAFVSFPAAIVYDLGLFGFFVVTFALGFFIGLLVFLYKKGHIFSYFGLGVMFYFESILILSPMLPAYGFSYINFVFFAFLLVGFFNIVFFGKAIRVV